MAGPALPSLGDIGEPLRHWEFEPLTAPAPAQPVPVPEPAPATPEPTRQPVPA